MQAQQAPPIVVESKHEDSEHLGLPFSAVLGLMAGLAVFSVSLHGLRDIDLYWHLLAGQELAQGVSPSELGLNWTFTAESAPWTTTQWLSELLLFRLHELGGWTALAMLRVTTAAVCIAVLAHSTLRGRPKALAGFPFVAAVVAVAMASQERPQQVTLIGAAVLGGTLAAGITREHLPRWYLLVPGTILWANLHGGWILVPIVMGLIAAGRALDQGVRDPLARRSVALMLMSAAAGAVTPAGWAGATAAIRFQDAAGDVVREWQRTSPFDPIGALTILMLVMIAVGWANSRRVPASELLVFFACLVFSWMAWRNVAPGLSLAAPLVAARLASAFPMVRPGEPRWSAPVGIGAATLLTAFSLFSLVGREHLPLDAQPIGLAKQISALPTPQRVLNDYNAAGAVLYFGGTDTRVAIDGRTDRYGAQYIEDYVGLRSLQGDWADMLDGLDPTSALFEEDSPIVHVLQADRGWQVIGRENGWVLLTPAEQ